MNSILKILKSSRKCYVQGNFVFFSSGTYLKQVPRPLLRNQQSSTSRIGGIGPYGWFLLVIPISSFSLGVWQIQRKEWKENLIVQLEERLKSEPIELPKNLDDIRNLEYQPIHVRGTFLHDQEMYIGPRKLIESDTGGIQYSFANMLADKQGYLVITPLKLADRDETILVNRGWVTKNLLRPKYRTQGQIQGVVDVIGVARSPESKPWIAVENTNLDNVYFSRDIDGMCAATGAYPIFLDQTRDFNVPGGPIGGQTNVVLRNEHMSYIITWFALGAATTFMWYKQFLAKRL